MVILNEDFEIEQGLWISRELVEELFPHKPYVNGRIITVTNKLLAHPDVQQIHLSDSLLDATP